jgi:hypothetical protein
VECAEAPHRERPFVKLVTALAQRMRDALLGAGNMTVERHRYAKSESAHWLLGDAAAVKRSIGVATSI